MRYVKTLGLLAAAATALMALVGSAAATVATSPAGTTYTGTLKGENTTPVTFHGVVDLTCNKAEIEGSVEQHGAGVTANGRPGSFTYSGCNQHITPLTKGTIEVHAIGGGNGTVTSSGTSATLLFTTIFGNIHCLFATNSTDIGVVTGAASNTEHATVHLEGVIPVIPPSNSLCGSSAEITGSGKVTSPTGLRID